MKLEIRLDGDFNCRDCQFWKNNYCRVVRGTTYSNESCSIHVKRTDAKPIKRVITHQGLKIGVTHDTGDYRFNHPMMAGYGHIRKSYGKAEDGLALDVYLGSNLKQPEIWKVRQLQPETGMLDEHKYFIGFSSPGEVRDTFCHHAGDDRFGGIEKCSLEELNSYREDKKYIENVKLDYCGCPDMESQLKVGVSRLPELLSQELSDLRLNKWKAPDVIGACIGWGFPGDVEEILSVEFTPNGIEGLFKASTGIYKYATKSDTLIAWSLQDSPEFEFDQIETPPLVSVKVLPFTSEPSADIKEYTKVDALPPVEEMDELDWITKDMQSKLSDFVSLSINKIREAIYQNESGSDKDKLNKLKSYLEQSDLDRDKLANIMYESRIIADLFGRSSFNEDVGIG